MKVQVILLSWRFRLQVNGPPRNWRDSVGDVLRLLAEKIDGRVSLGVQAATEPPIGHRRMLECLNLGFDAARRALESEARAEAEETVLRQMHGELFDESDECPTKRS